MGQNQKSVRVKSYTAYGEEQSFSSFHTAEQFWTTVSGAHCVNVCSMCRAAFPYNDAPQPRKIDRRPMFQSNWYNPPPPPTILLFRTLEAGTAVTSIAHPASLQFLDSVSFSVIHLWKNTSFRMTCPVKHGIFQSIRTWISLCFTQLQLSLDPEDCQNFFRDIF
jgi:hypothetical protein